MLAPVNSPSRCLRVPGLRGGRPAINRRALAAAVHPAQSVREPEADPAPRAPRLTPGVEDGGRQTGGSSSEGNSGRAAELSPSVDPGPQTSPFPCLPTFRLLLLNLYFAPALELQLLGGETALPTEAKGGPIVPAG
ncbi:PREDICTED: cardiotrophin-1-like [Chrysochloris asiatica]|uniref:Cardiotrophin-1-like n=1 Tax=Chrysochloris asiatica TaxID=185453 RepID=A0A9B0TLT7_CHRAS|nr:PREDICTED: cardiotrophin-1-like [Chrysochloris asiatica]